VFGATYNAASARSKGIKLPEKVSRSSTRDGLPGSPPANGKLGAAPGQPDARR